MLWKHRHSRGHSAQSEIPFSQRATLALCAHLFADENERRTSETKAARESVEAVLDARFLVRRMTPKTPPPKPIHNMNGAPRGRRLARSPGISSGASADIANDRVKDKDSLSLGEIEQEGATAGG